jgi:hypothetical protein
MRFFMSRFIAVTLALSFAQASESRALSVQLSVPVGVSPEVASAIERGAQRWEQVLSNPVVVNVEVSLSPLASSSTLATTSAVLLQESYGNVRAALGADGTVGGLLPVSGIDVALPPDFLLGDHVEGTKANFKALGFTGLDERFGALDASILINSSAPFDLDPSDGVDTGHFDLEGLMAHELAHVLGFVSSVDWIDSVMGGVSGVQSVDPTLFDLFRFGSDVTDLGAEGVALSSRNLVPGQAGYFRGAGAFSYALSTGRHNGDGRQASHWKDDSLTGTWLGVVDPTIARGSSLALTSADVEALDTIGWSAVPEPSVGVLMVVGGALTCARRRSGARRSNRRTRGHPGRD